MNYIIIATIILSFGTMAIPQLNNSNPNKKQIPLTTKSQKKGKIHLDIDHSGKGDVTAECDDNPEQTTVSADPDRPVTKVVYHNCDLTYDVK